MADQGLRRLSCRQEVPVRKLAEEQELRTLTFGDRTISYDTGLNCVPKYGEQPSNDVLNCLVHGNISVYSLISSANQWPVSETFGEPALVIDHACWPLAC